MAKNDGFTAVAHQQEVGASYYDDVQRALGIGSLSAMEGSTKKDQFSLFQHPDISLYNKIVKIDILTLFPEMFDGAFSESMIKRAQEKGLVKIKIHNLRNWSVGKHNTVDGKPYSGGSGMVLMVEPVYKALKDLKEKNSRTVLLSPQGERYSQRKAKEFSKAKHLILIAGHYEGFDERIRENLIDEEISIGDYILTGGEVPAMAIVDSVIRLIPKVLGSKESLKGETHSKKNFKKHPVYTKPEDFNGWKVPEVLLSGDHKKIEEWKKSKSKKQS